jgi:ABC-2 type transport system permease protein
MAELIVSAEARGQLAAIARVRWQLFVNSLRTMRGRLEMVSHIFIGFSFAIGAVGGAVALGAGAYFLLLRDRTEWIAFLLWPILLFWQLFPVVATAFTETFDSSNLLRFPLSYPSFFMVRLVYGSLDPATALGIVWLLGLWAGVAATDRRLALPSALALLTFAMLNIVLARMIFAWVERWLARRRTREIMGVLFFFLIISFQFIGPLTARFNRGAHPEMTRLVETLMPIERALPPGLVASAIAQFSRADFVAGFGSFALLWAYPVAFSWLLNVRILAQYRGESLSEGVARVGPASRRERLPARAGWDVPLVSGPTAAIFEKEWRYLSRSGPMLFTLFMPLIILVIFRLSSFKSGGGSFMKAAPDFAFPIGAAYALLMLTNLVYNNFGADGGSIQFWFVSPVRFREIVRAKNLVHSTVLAGELVLVWVVVSFIFRPPSLAYTLATVAAVLFATPVNLLVGNLLSIYTPKKFDFGTFGKQRAASTTAFASFLVQAAVFGVAAFSFVLGRFLGGLWVATLILLALAGIAFACYGVVLRRVDAIAFQRRETLISELSRA